MNTAKIIRCCATAILTLLVSYLSISYSVPEENVEVESLQ